MVLSRGTLARAKRWLIRVSAATLPMKSSTTAWMAGLPPSRSYSGFFVSIPPPAHPAVSHPAATSIATAMRQPMRRLLVKDHRQPVRKARGRAPSVILLYAWDRAHGFRALRLSGARASGTRARMSSPRALVPAAELVARVARGDEGAFGQLYDAYAGLAFGLIRRILRQKEAAEEVLQEVFWQVWREAGTFDAARGSAEAWLLMRARTRAIDKLRSMRRTDQTFVAPVDEATARP